MPVALDLPRRVTFATTVEITESFHASDRIAVPQLTYRDSAGNVVQTKTFGFDGTAIVTEKDYDPQGRPVTAYQPRFSTETAKRRASAQDYDDLGRVIAVRVYEEAGSGDTAHQTTTEYQGLVVTLTNPKFYTRVDSLDVLGRVLRVTDANVNGTSFAYDPFGNLTQTIDPNGNVIDVKYDTLGRKIQLDDPDLGTIDYRVDARGLTWQQISPNQRALGQTTRTDYDLLGRMVTRREPDLISNWLYDAPGSGKSIGQLSQATTTTASGATDYRRTHRYDELGRLSETSQELTGGVYQSKNTYDPWGRLITNTYTNTRGGIVAADKVFDSRYNAYGYLNLLQRGTTPLWKVKTQDASQRPIEIDLGNGLTQTRNYDRNAARLKSAALKVRADNDRRLEEIYQYDSLASVINRTQSWETTTFSEQLDYDQLNRLRGSRIALLPAQVLGFDDAGNIKNKSDVGGGLQWSYPQQGKNSVRPHAVLSIPGIPGAVVTTNGGQTKTSNDFAYDDNGNFTGGAGISATWTSFDMPKTIQRNGSSSTFVYGPEHQRTRQDRNDGSNIVYAGAQEVETNAGLATVKTYWPYGVGVEIERPNKALELNWVHVDRLGSPVAISDAFGKLSERMAYDPWGKRRTLTGAPENGTATPNNIDNQRGQRRLFFAAFRLNVGGTLIASHSLRRRVVRSRFAARQSASTRECPLLPDRGNLRG